MRNLVNNSSLDGYARSFLKSLFSVKPLTPEEIHEDRVIIVMQDPKEPRLAMILRDLGCTGENNVRMLKVEIEGQRENEHVKLRHCHSCSEEMTLAWLCYENALQCQGQIIKSVKGDVAIGTYRDGGIQISIERDGEALVCLVGHLGDELEFGFENLTNNIKPFPWHLVLSFLELQAKGEFLPW